MNLNIGESFIILACLLLGVATSGTLCLIVINIQLCPHGLLLATPYGEGPAEIVMYLSIMVLCLASALLIIKKQRDER